MKTNNDNMHNFFTEAKNMLGVNLGDNDQCDEFEYIKEIKKVVD